MAIVFKKIRLCAATNNKSHRSYKSKSTPKSSYMGQNYSFDITKKTRRTLKNKKSGLKISMVNHNRCCGNRNEMRPALLS